MIPVNDRLSVAKAEISLVGWRQRGCVCRWQPRFRAVALAAVFAREGCLRLTTRANSLSVRWKNAYSAGQKTARAQAATKQFSRTNPIATSW